MTAPKEILTLVERFDRSREAYLSGEYNETQLRREFLDPFFKALGWDVENTQGYAEPYKDVVHEDAIKIGTVTKAPDYSFRIGGVRKFFVEAKKPAVNVKEDISPAYQLRRYAWSAKLPLSILTDFEEFAVYDCRVRPLPTDKSSTNRTIYLRCTDYETKWDEIADVFSKDAVLKGSFDKYAETNKRKRGTAEVDDAFLHEIEEWRTALAANIALRNADLSQRELNFAVQRTIDRIIFLRICEDRGIETYGALMSLQNSERIYKRLVETFHRADERYNSGLFHFRPEKERNEPPDEMTLGLDIDDKPLKEIIKSLYYPHSPYEFSVLPADILGQVYEQFLGKVIRLTAGHRAVVEDKPEVKKAGGVYYTPTYIVEYIVKNTVGRLLNSDLTPSPTDLSPALSKGEGVDLTPAPSPNWRGVSEGRGEVRKQMTPKQVSKLRILDPACGSGSFLIGAYQYLLDWHRDWYMKDGPEKWAKGKSPTLYQASHPTLGEDPPPHLRRGQGGGAHWRLTTTERKRILLNNIYGVDIDAQAVETTKLSLLLKVLEGENEQTISRQLKMFHERALPDLGSNIKCGNSLIGPDFYSDDLFASVGAIRESPLRGGKAKSLADDERLRINAFDWKTEFKEIMDAGGFDAVIGNPPYIQSRSEQLAEQDKNYFMQTYRTAEYQLNTFGLFIERSHDLLKAGGLFGMIIPNYWLSTKYNLKLRLFLFKQNTVLEILNVYNVFEDASVDTVVLITQRHDKKDWSQPVLIRSIDRKLNSILVRLLAVQNREWALERLMAIDRDAEDVTVTFSHNLNLKGTSQLGQFFDFRFGMKPYQVGKGKPPQTKAVVQSKQFEANKKIGGDYERVLKARNVQRYHLIWEGDWIKYGDHLAEPRSLSLFTGERILLQRIVSRDRLDVTIAFETYICNTDVITLKPTSKSPRPDTKFSVGVLGSIAVGYYVKSGNVNLDRATYPKINTATLASLPLPTINLSDPTDKSRHDRMVSLVEQMLALHKQLASAKTDHEKTALQRQIDTTDKQIDELVYELYGLTEDERRIVEGK
jgi:hypothetical protein